MSELGGEMLRSPWIIGPLILLAAASVLGVLLMLRARHRRRKLAAKVSESAVDADRNAAIDILLGENEELKEAIKSGRVKFKSATEKDPRQQALPRVMYSLGPYAKLEPGDLPTPHIELPREAFAETPSDLMYALGAGSGLDDVSCSVFTKPKIYRGWPAKIQVLLHLRSEVVSAAKLAAKEDVGTNRRATAMLDALISRGTEVEMFIDCPEMEIEEPLKSITWEGRAASIVFRASVPRNSTVTKVRPVAYIQAGSVPIGELEFSIGVEDRSFSEQSSATMLSAVGAPVEMATAEEFVDTVSTPYNRPFISYSRKDFERVSFFAQGLEERGIAPIVDVTNLEPGDDWAEKLPEFVRDADVVYVMWSSNAASSRWVDQESRLACQLHEASGDRRPRVKPMLMEQLSPKLPDHLARFHASSVWQALRTAHQVGVFEDKPEGP